MLKRSITAQLTLTLFVVSAVVLAGFAVMIGAARTLQTADQARAGSARALSDGTQLEQAVLDLETGLRGYLLAGRPVFLQPYTAARSRLPSLVGTLEAQTASDPVAHRYSVAIAAAIHAYVTQWTEPVIRLAGRDLGAARRAEAGGGGKARVDAMRTQFAVLTAREATTYAGRVGESGRLANVVLVAGLAAVLAFGLLIAYVAIRARRGLAVPLRRLATAVAAITGGDFEVRVPGGGAAEVGQLIHGFNRMAESLGSQRGQLEDHGAELEAQKSELEAALGSLEERSERIERLRHFGDRLAAQASLESMSAATLNGIADAGGCDLGVAYLLEPDADVYVPVAWRGVHRRDLPLDLRPGEGLAGRALAERGMVSVSYGEATMQTEAIDQRRVAAHEVHLPIVHGDRTFGVISIGRLHDDPFTDDDQVLVCDLADRAGVNWAQALANRQMQHAAHELSAVLETIDEGVYGINSAGEITLVNRAALELTGYSREEMVGRNSHALLHHSHEDGTPYPEEACPVFRSLAGEGVRTTGEVYWRRDGTPFPVEYASYPLFRDGEVTGAVVTFLDRTARRQIQRQRDTQHALTRIFAEASSLAEARPLMLAAVCEGLGFEVGLSWQAGEDEDVMQPVSTYAAPGFEELVAKLGGGDTLSRHGTLAGRVAERRDAVVCTDLDLDPPRSGPIDDPRLQTAVGMVGRTGTGSLVSVAELFSCRAVPEEGLLDMLRVIGSQIAQYIERQRAEEDAQRMKDQIVANVSHELRTPLTAIDGWVHVLLGEEPGPLTDEQHRFLTIVKRNSDRLMRLVGDLLLAGQVEAGKLKLEREDVDVAELARETAELVSSAAEAKHIALHVDAEDSVLVHGDRQRLGQLLTNLVANAIKFTPEHGSVDVGVDRRNGSCRITVADTGIGVPRSERERLFERFYRASSATSLGITGTGLGLAISKAIAESHQGTISLADDDGPGAKFVVELPMTTREEVFT